MECECCFKDQNVGAIEGAKFIVEQIIPVTKKAFDDFAGDDATDLKGVLGLK